MKNVSKLLTRSMLLIAMSMLLFAKVGWSQTYIQIGEGTTSYAHPFYAYYADNRDQIIYYATQMAGLSAGPITKIAFNFTTTTGYTMNNFTLSMANTTNTNVGVGFIPTTNIYYRATESHPGVSGWHTYTLDVPFVWDGTSNIVLQFCHDNSDYDYGTYWNSQATYVYEVGVYKNIYAYTDVGAGCSLPPQYISYYQTNIRLYQPGTLSGTVTNSVNGAPIAGATVSGGSGTTTTLANGTYTMQVDAGTNDFTATGMPTWLPATQSATVPMGGTATLNFSLDPNPAWVNGIITNAANGNPVKGARVEVNGNVTWSVEGGLYTLGVFPGGSFTIDVYKTGFQDLNSGPYTFVTGTTQTVNLAIEERLERPTQPFTAALNTGATAVDLSWGIPVGYYELIYDDGILDITTVWAQGGNMNGVKFTGLNNPVTLYGGSVNIGSVDDYPAGTTIATVAPFQMQVYDATGTGGAPGVAIGDPIDIAPANFGWNEFTIPNHSFTGNFYLVMIQGGNADVAARLGVDNTASQLRSWSRFVTGSGPWLPADGNFMIRAKVIGTGGPLDATEALLGYQVYRLFQGQEPGPATLWTSIATPTGTTAVDNSWPSLPDSAFRWAVKAKYTGNRWSDYIFSNVLGKNRMVNVVVNVALTCAVNPLEGSLVTLTCTAPGVDTVYTMVTDATGAATFPQVFKGPYQLKVTRFGYDTYTANVSIYADRVFDVTILQMRVPPTNMFVNDRSLLATWSPPGDVDVLFNETFDGGFGPNLWVASVSNWTNWASLGNPAPSARVSWTPSATSYSWTLTSKTFTGSGNPQLHLSWDINLDDFSSNGTEHMTVEISTGGTWTVLKTYSNTGNIPWTTDEVSLAAYTNSNFQIRFNCNGAQSAAFDYWYIDNVKIWQQIPDPTLCLLAYNVYLDNIVVGVTLDTTFNIPPNQVQYGHPYEACVKAVYGSGYSDPSCYDFISKFLYPPTNLEVVAVECVAYLTWEKPQVMADFVITDVQPRTEFPNSSVDYCPDMVTVSGYEYSDAIWDILFYWNANNVGAMPGIEGSGTDIYLTCWSSSFAPPWFQKYDMTTGTWIEDFDIAGATMIRDMAYDGTYFYGAPGTTSLYQMDFASHTLISTINASGASSGIRHIAYDPLLDGGAGGFWCGNWYDMKAITMSGALLYNGPALAACYGSAYDNQSPGGPFLWTYEQTGTNLDNVIQWQINYSPLGLTPTGIVWDAGVVPGFIGGSIAGGLCSKPVGSKFALIGSIQQAPNLVWGVEVAEYAGPGGDPLGLLGYNVYRNGNYIETVTNKDTTWYYDFNVNPGTHNYAVTAWYDLTPYGFPGMFDESMIEGPVEVTIECGRDLPFCEDWEFSSFAYNDWTFDPDQGNWTTNVTVGLPAPSADFSWLPFVVDYSNSLISPVLNAGPYSCATIWLDYDYKLVDRNATGDEMLTVEAYWGNAWHEVAVYTNDGDVDWTSEHFDISSGAGRAIMVRFTASGANSEDILHWYVDNICVYGVCLPPTDLTFDDPVIDQDVYLTWTSPNCPTIEECTPQYFQWDGNVVTNGTSINPGYDIKMGNVFPVNAAMSGLIQSIDMYFSSSASSSSQECIIYFYDAAENLIGTSDPFMNPGAAWPAGTWVNVPIADIPFTGPFYALVDYAVTSTPFKNYFVWDGVTTVPLTTGLAWTSIDGVFGNAADAFGYAYPMTFLQRGTLCVYAKDGPEVITFDPSIIPANQNGTLVSGAGVDFGANMNVQSSGQPTGIISGPGMRGDAAELLGYNVFRSDDEQVTWDKLNTTPIPDTTYADMNVSFGWHYYYVTSVFDKCESPASNIIDVDVISGINDLSNGTIKIYPNPATEIVNVQSDFTILDIEVMNFLGQTVYTQRSVDMKTTKINVSSLQAGVYFVKVTTQQGVRAVKITVTR